MGKRGPQPGSKKQKVSGFSEHITTGIIIGKDKEFTFYEAPK